MMKKDITPQMLKLMSESDQAKYGPEVRPSFEDDPHPPPVTDKLERDEQRSFANWCLLHLYPFYWHSTAHKTKASVGCPDFIVGAKGKTFWIEFKRAPNPLTPDQKKFKELLEGQGIIYHVVYSCGEAIKLTEYVTSKEYQIDQLKAEIARLNAQLEGLLEPFAKD
jgi:hypothetical protein